MTAAPPLPLRGTLAGFRRFTVAEYERLIRDGYLSEDDDIELLDGYLVNKMARNPLHDGTLYQATDRLRALLPAGWLARGQMGLTLARSQPEPDIAIVRPEPHGYKRRHPVAADAELVVEVADSSLETDRLDKCPLYAADNIPAYWIVNLQEGWVEVYTDPDPYGRVYTTRTDYRPGDSVPLILDGVQVATVPAADLLP